jgi:DNA invertase Pin-like site-specific DNA recombinase
MLFGYARVSTLDQDLDAQVNCLKAAGCEKIFHEKEKGGKWERPQLHKMLSEVKEGDTIIVWKLDRLSRSLSDLLAIIQKIDKAGCSFKSLTEALDTTTPAGRMLMHVIGAIAEFEKSLLRERTLSGLHAAKLRGKVGGRPFKLNKDQQIQIANLVSSGVQTAADAARLFNLDPSTISRLLKRHREHDFV